MTLIKQPTPENILLAARNLKDGALIGLPTETVYGLAADAENESAVKRIYDVKGRPENHPVIIHIGNIKYLTYWAVDIPDIVWKIIEEFWPGPLTIVLKRQKNAQNFITGGQNTVALRFPRNEIALNVLQNFHVLGGNGLAAPSANSFGLVSPTKAQDVDQEIGDRLCKETDFILDGGNCEIGLESTILNCVTTPEILRFGQISETDLSKVVQLNKLNEDQISNIRVPGHYKSHYAPHARIRIGNKTSVGDGFIAMSNITTPIGAIRLAEPKTINEFAKTLYSSFRKGDILGLKNIFIEVPEGFGLEKAIKDRILRASVSNNKQ